MKTSASAFPFLLALSTASLAAVEEVQSGASLETMRADLGRSRGQLQVGARRVVYYERGEVELQNGALTRVTVRSPEEQAILVAREERLRDEREVRRTELLAEGTALRAQKLADPSFQAAPLADQVSFWEDFARRYPEVSCAEPLMIARVRLNVQNIEQRQRDEEARRRAEIEERLAVAEQRRAFYPARRYSRHSGRHHPQAGTGLWPVTYTYFDSPLPPYSTPAGNPAGDFTGPSTGNPAGQSGVERERPRWEQGNRPDRSNGWGAHGSRGRM